MNTPASSCPTSGSSPGSSRAAASSTVTVAPKRAKTWANSQPTGPAPSTISDSGTCSTATASRLVQYGAPASPSIGGTAGSVPGLSTIPLAAWNTRAPSEVDTVTSPGAVIVARPRTNRPPAFSNRCTATVSSQLSVASARIRVATGAQSERTRALPASSATRRASPSASAARSIIFVGTQA